MTSRCCRRWSTSSSAATARERPPREQFEAELKAFLDPVEAAFGKPAVVYLIGEADRRLCRALFLERQRWLRSLSQCIPAMTTGSTGSTTTWDASTASRATLI